jgi:hypothetical protein
MKTLIATFAITTSASAGILTFDNLPSTYRSSTGNGEQLTNSVDGFTFTSTTIVGVSQNNWYYYNAKNPHITNNGSNAYAIGVRGTTAMYSGYYDNSLSVPNATYNISRTDGSLWNFNQAVFTSVWAPGNIHLMGYRNGVQVLDITQGISNTQQTMVGTGSYPGPINWIDTLKITNTVAITPLRHFVMDDMYYTLSVPAPSVLAMIGLAVCGTSNRRRKDSNG